LEFALHFLLCRLLLPFLRCLLGLFFWSFFPRRRSRWEVMLLRESSTLTPEEPLEMDRMRLLASLYDEGESESMEADRL
jgi:hypothetical protein